MVPLKDKRSSSVIEGLNLIFCRTGIPLALHLDNAKELSGGLFRRAASALGITLAYSSCYHSQSLGLLERKHKDIAAMLKSLTMKSGANWDRHLPYIQYQINTTQDQVTGFSSWELFHGHGPRKVDFVKEPLPAEGKISLDSIQLRKWHDDLQRTQEKTFGTCRAQKTLKKFKIF